MHFNMFVLKILLGLGASFAICFHSPILQRAVKEETECQRENSVGRKWRLVTWQNQREWHSCAASAVQQQASP